MPYLIAQSGPLKDNILDLDDKEKYIIGRDPDIVDFVIEDSSVSRKHSLIYKKDGMFYIKNLSKTNPVLINDSSIQKEYALKDKDVVQIGKSLFLYTEQAPDIKYTPYEHRNEGSDKDLETVFENIDEDNNDEEYNTTIENVDEKNNEEYETIFEEEPEEEVPYNLISEDSIILKVISGPNAGAEFSMEKNHNYILGKDADVCDIAFNDLSVSKEHGKITVDENGDIFIEDLGSKNGIIINAKKIRDKQKITSKDIILMGTTTFIVLDLKDAQETIYSPIPTIEQEIPKQEEPIVKKDWKELIIPKKHLIIAASIFLVFFISFIAFFSLFKAKKIEIVQKDPSQEIMKIVSKYPGVEFSYNPGGETLFLLGNISTAISQKELLYELNNLEYFQNIENNVVIDEYVWKNINDLLSDNPNWRSVNLQAPNPGQFIVMGYLKTSKELDELSNYLNANFPYVEQLKYDVVVENVLNMQIEGLIIAKGFSSISFKLTNGELVVAGRYSKESEGSFDDLLSELKKLNGVRSIKNIALKTTEDMARIDLTNKFKISGFIAKDDNNIAVIANNKIFGIGDFLEDMKITAIKSNSVYLEKQGLKYKIDYNP